MSKTGKELLAFFGGLIIVMKFSLNTSWKCRVIIVIGK